MNQIVIGGLTAMTPAERPNRRALAKRRTREKVLEAGKRLFSERGYEGATIRDIAGVAGMSTGAIFASFADKSDLFGEILAREQDALLAAMRAAKGERKGGETVALMLEAAAERHMAELGLLQAAMSTLWTPQLGAHTRRRFGQRAVLALIASALRESPSVSGDIDAEGAAEMLWETYLSSLRRAALDGLSLNVVKARIREQTRIILSGWRRG
jgi:AcrR family transcriptional regulator